MAKVLHLVSSLSINSGLMSVIMNYYRAIDRNKVQFGFLYFKKVPDNTYEDEIKLMGGEIFYFQLNQYNPFKSFKCVFEEIAGRYDILHVHELYLMFAAEKIARNNGIKKIIGHAHTIKYSENIISGIRNRILCIGLNKRCDYRMACSEEAGKVFFGNNIYLNKFCVLNNAIDVDLYRFNKSKRDKIRKEMQVSDNEILIGHVGRFTHPKNHPFIVEIIDGLVNRDRKYKLVLIGDGEGEKQIKTLVKEKNLVENVIFLGSRMDVNLLYSAMDIFLFPSLYEGLGFVAIEAQANGLKCFLSNAVPKRAKVLDSCQIIDLCLGSDYWVEEIINSDIRREINGVEIVSKSGFDIDTERVKLEGIYKELASGA